MGLCDKIKRLIAGEFTLHSRQIPVPIPILKSDLLKGRSALITGGTRGIGLSIAEAFLNAGASVVITGRHEADVNAVIGELGCCKRQVIGVTLDVTNVNSFEQVIDSVFPFDILVNNAGFVGGNGFGRTTEKEYSDVMDTNLKGAYFLSQAVTNRWIERGVKGNVLNICSASSLRPGDSPYVLSKWGMRSLTIGMARQLIRHGIVVNGLAPGVANTDRFVNVTGDISKPNNPFGRMVTKEEIANMAVVLTSSLCRMVVGDVLYMTGGGAIVTMDD